MFSFEHRCKWLSILVFIPFYATSLQSQEPSPEPDIAWVQNYSTVKFDGQDTPKDMLVDKSGNIYALANVVNLTNPPSIFLVKLDSSGQEQWRVQYKDGSGKRSKGVGLGLDAEQNIYVLGYITANDSLSEIITIKYDAFGNQLWSVQYQGEFGSTATALAVSSAGDLYISGNSKTINDDWDIAAIKYDTNGQQQWIYTYDSQFALDDKASDICVGNDDNVYVTGTSWTNDDTIRQVVTIRLSSEGEKVWDKIHQIGADESGATAVVPGSSSHVYVLARNSNISEIIKYDAAGQELWVQRTVSDNPDGTAYANAITIDHEENIYLAGITSQPHNNDFLTVKYDSAGMKMWTAIYNGMSVDDVATALTIDANGNIYITGRTRSASFSSYHDYDFATVKYDADGVEQWARHYETFQVEGAMAISVTSDKVVVMGVTEFFSLRKTAIVQYSLAGTQIWETRLKTTSHPESIGGRIGIDSQDNIYLLGTKHLDDFSSNYIAVKYSPTGELLWETEYSGRPEQPLNSLRDAVVDLEGNTYLGGLRFSFQQTDLNVVKIDKNGQQQWDYIINADDSRGNPTIHAMAVRGETLCLSTSDASKGLICLNASGLVNWIFPQDLFETIYRILFDDQNNIYTIGRHINDRFVFIRRYDSVGNLNWSTQLEEASIFNVDAPFAVQKEGYIYITVTGFGTAHSVTGKYTLEGEQVWLHEYTDVFANPVAVAVDDSGNVYGSGIISTPETGRDYFLLKYNKDGINQWFHTYNGWQDGNDEVESIVIDQNHNIILTGSSYRQSVPDNRLSVDYSTVAYNSDGDILWDIQYNSPGDRDDFVSGLVLDSQNDVIISGISSFNVFLPNVIFSQSVATTTIKYINSVPTSVTAPGTVRPNHPFLEQNYPNPFNPVTLISFYLPEQDQVELIVYNLFGQKVKTLLNGISSAGRQSIAWDGHDEKGKPVASGLYFYKLESSRFVENKRMLLLR